MKLIHRLMGAALALSAGSAIASDDVLFTQWPSVAKVDLDDGLEKTIAWYREKIPASA